MGAPIVVKKTHKDLAQKTFKSRWRRTAVPGRDRLCLYSSKAAWPPTTMPLCWYNLCLLHRVLPPLVQSLLPTSCTNQPFSTTSCTTPTPALQLYYSPLLLRLSFVQICQYNYGPRRNSSIKYTQWQPALHQ